MVSGSKGEMLKSKSLVAWVERGLWQIRCCAQRSEGRWAKVKRVTPAWLGI